VERETELVGGGAQAVDRALEAVIQSARGGEGVRVLTTDILTFVSSFPNI
jgi:hypothetical protein